MTNDLCSNFGTGTCKQIFSHWCLPCLRNKLVSAGSRSDQIKGVGEELVQVKIRLLYLLGGGGGEGQNFSSPLGFAFLILGVVGEGWIHTVKCVPLPWKVYADVSFSLVLWTCRHLGNSCSSLFSFGSAVYSGQQGCYRWQRKIRVVLSSLLRPASELSWQKGLPTDSWQLWKLMSCRVEWMSNWNKVPNWVPSRVKTFILLTDRHFLSTS